MHGLGRLKFFFSNQTIFRNPRDIRSYSVPSSERCNLPAAAIHATSDTVVIVDINAPAAHVAQHKWQPNTPDGQGTPFLFQHGKASLTSASGTFMRMFKGQAGSVADEWQFPQAPAFAASGIRSSSIVSITWDKDVITGKHLFNYLSVLPYFFNFSPIGNLKMMRKSSTMIKGQVNFRVFSCSIISSREIVELR